MTKLLLNGIFSIIGDALLHPDGPQNCFVVLPPFPTVIDTPSTITLILESL